MSEISLDELRPYAGTFPVLPLWRKRRAAKSPIEAFRLFKRISRQCFILESLEDKERWGRWTFLGFEPKLEISCMDGLFRIKNGATIERHDDNPAAAIEKILAEYRSPALSTLAPGADLPPFSGGLVGYFSFDYVNYSEPSLKNPASGTDAPVTNPFKDLDLMLFDKLLVWDNLRSELYFFVNIKTETFEENYHRALTELDRLERVLESSEEAALPPLRITSKFREHDGRERYCMMVERAKQYIREGDIFQVVLSNQLEAEVEGSIFGAYLVLRTANPSPYMFYFTSDDIEIAGASPETLVKMIAEDDGAASRIWTFPLAGTRRRGKTDKEDQELEQELRADPKELAEHNMLVDLGRNDLGRICEFGSVKVEKYLSIERFSHVMHLGSTVTGVPCAGASALDAIAAVLPAGTLSGAPKIRAIEIIRELETAPRGIYGGAIGYIAFSGGMDTCISIRLAYKKDRKVYVRAGAGIVADSIPENEYEECRNKMRAVVSALKEASFDTPY
ncbi:MAG: anthranilate synthase component I family protein [Spirochaetaceae bacterium]|jgi:anthranilate synthase component 1|nr:anthranilate synthase component I family protein [Spirochaetaceae bacterium]